MFEIKWIFYGLSRMLQFSEFVWPRRYSVWDVCINFLLIDATDRSKISSDQKRFFIELSLYPLSFLANTPFKFIVDTLFHSKHLSTIFIAKEDALSGPFNREARKRTHKWWRKIRTHIRETYMLPGIVLSRKNPRTPPTNIWVESST